MPLPVPDDLMGVLLTPESYGIKPNYVYVASSWRNPMQPAICAALASAGIDHYDFRNPRPDNDGFRWSDVGMPSYDRGTNGPVPAEEYMTGIEHPVAKDGYRLDMGAMVKADTFVLVQECGRSAHLELGWAAGFTAAARTFLDPTPDMQDEWKRTAVLFSDPCTPDLMYRMCDFLTPSLMDLLGWLGVED